MPLCSFCMGRRWLHDPRKPGDRPDSKSLNRFLGMLCAARDAAATPNCLATRGGRALTPIVGACAPVFCCCAFPSGLPCLSLLRWKHHGALSPVSTLCFPCPVPGRYGCGGRISSQSAGHDHSGQGCCGGRKRSAYAQQQRFASGPERPANPGQHQQPERRAGARAQQPQRAGRGHPHPRHQQHRQPRQWRHRAVGARLYRAQRDHAAV